MTDLVVYDDSPVFGGHEVMSLLAVEGLLRSNWSVTFYSCPKNTRLTKALERLSDEFALFTFNSSLPAARRFQGLWTLFEKSKIRTLGRSMAGTGAHTALILQGDIELSARGVLAAKAAGMHTVSYIPYGHTFTRMGAKFAALRDLSCRRFFDAADAYITISDSAKSELFKAGCRKPVEVVHNGIAMLTDLPNRDAARLQYDLPLNARVMAVVGRLECKQKGQDVMLQALASSPELLANSVLLIVGTGPDEQKLKKLVSKLGLEPAVRFIDWCDTHQLYPALDVLVIPSHFEGVPLVMLEALAAGVPVIGTDRDGMQDVLPAEWRFPDNNRGALIHAITVGLSAESRELSDRLQQQVRETMSIPTFQSRFVAALEKLQVSGGVGHA